MHTTVIRRPQSVLEIVEQDGSKLIRKWATPTGKEELLQQLEFYRLMPREISRHYPVLIAANDFDEPPNFTMPYYDYPTLTQLVLYSSLGARELSEKLMKVLAFLLTVQHPYRTAVPTEDYVLSTYITRVTKRLTHMARIDDLFRQIVGLSYITLDGCRIRSPFRILDELSTRRDVLEELQPALLYLTHGQLRFDHILIDPKDPIGETFILLDPRGVRELRDIGYELGKISQCLSIAHPVGRTEGIFNRIVFNKED